MKKAKQALSAEEPMGIVLAWGSGIPVQAAPMVRAYYWCCDESAATSRADDRLAVSKG